MIVTWMVYCIAASLLVTAAGVAIEAVLRATRRPLRFVWGLALGVSALWGGVVALVPDPPESAAVTSRVVMPGVQIVGAAAARVTERAFSVSADDVLMALWAAATLALLARLLFSMRVLAARRREWGAQSVDGVDVRISQNIGPAVVGIDPMDVVLPVWALDLDEPLRELVLRHENEHRRARDPWMLIASRVLVALMPWNPALWWQSRRLALAIELDCDARVLRVRPDRERYGMLLLAIAQRRSVGARSLLATAMSESATNLSRRIEAMRVLTKRVSRVRVSLYAGVAVAAIAVACSMDAPQAPMQTGTSQLAASRTEAPQQTSEVQLLTRYLEQGERLLSDSIRLERGLGPTDLVTSEMLRATAKPNTNPAVRTKIARISADMESLQRALVVALNAAHPGCKHEFVGQTFGGPAFPTDCNRVGDDGETHVAGATQMKRRTTPGGVIEYPTTVVPSPDKLIEYREMVVPLPRKETVPIAPVVEPGTMKGAIPVTAPATVQPTRPDDRATTYYDFQVERVAAQQVSAAAPVYPEALKIAGVEGTVVASFVVNADGSVDVASFKAIGSARSEFIDAVRAALPSLRYKPALVGDKPVRQLVQLSFVFSIK